GMDASFLGLDHVIAVREHAARLVDDPHAARVGRALDAERPHRPSYRGPQESVWPAARPNNECRVRSGDGLRRPRTAPVRVPPDPREPDDGGGPPPRPRCYIRNRTHRGGPGRALAARRP